jgi:hypothetical protein
MTKNLELRTKHFNIFLLIFYVLFIYWEMLIHYTFRWLKVCELSFLCFPFLQRDVFMLTAVLKNNLNFTIKNIKGGKKCVKCFFINYNFVILFTKNPGGDKFKCFYRFHSHRLFHFLANSWILCDSCWKKFKLEFI